MSTDANANPSPPPRDGLFAEVYQHLRAIAQRRMSGERHDHTLQATALVNEVYLKLEREGRLAASEPRGAFYATAARAMRQVLVDHARAKGRDKRGGGRAPISNLDVVQLAAEEKTDEILALDEGLCRLESRSPRAAEVVKLRFYAGLTIDETADAMGISPRSVDDAWAFARAFLWRELNPPG